MRQKILKTGNSLAVTIPARFVRTLGLRPGGVVDTQVNYSSARITHAFPQTGQLSLLPGSRPAKN